MQAETRLPDVLGHRRHFTEAEALGDAILGGELDYMPMPGARYAATHSLLKLGSFVVQHVEDAPHIVRGAMAPDVLALVLLVAPPRTEPLVNGVESGGADMAIVPGGVEFVSSSVTSQSWAALTITRERLAELAEVAPPPVRSKGAVQILRLPARCMASLAAAIRATIPLIAHHQDALRRPGHAEGLAASMRDLIAEALTAEADQRGPSCATRSALQVVSGAEAFLEAHLTRPIYTEELCSALAVSPRRLHDAFKAALGTSPHRYLRARRLTLARRSLKGQTPRAGLVKSVALEHGFWHFGRFAQEYRDQFGETPSETLMAAHGPRFAPRSHLPNSDTDCPPRPGAPL